MLNLLKKKSLIIISKTINMSLMKKIDLVGKKFYFLYEDSTIIVKN